MDRGTYFWITLILGLCFYKSCVTQDGFEDLLSDPSGEMSPGKRAENTAKELTDIDEKMEICDGSAVGCYPGILNSPGKNFTENCMKDDSTQVKNVCDGDEVGKDVVEEGKEPPQGPSTEDEIYFWRCDFASRPCCRTCRRTTPMIDPIPTGQDIAYPVFCPVEGGFQLKDDVACVQQGCRKPCTKAFTLYSFLVTSIPPDGLNGHCNKTFLPVWFTSVKVDTHCICPKEGKNKG